MKAILTENKVVEIVKHEIENYELKEKLKKQSEVINGLMLQNIKLMKELKSISEFRKSREEHCHLSPDKFKDWLFLKAREL